MSISKNRGKSEIHKHYHRKNCNKTRAFVSIQLLTWEGGDKREREDVAKGGGGGDYSREAIIVNILVKGGLLFEGGEQSEGRLLFAKMRI